MIRQYSLHDAAVSPASVRRLAWGERPHGIMVVENTSKNFWLLLFPLLRGLIAWQLDLYSWVRGAWFDLTIVTVLLTSAVLRWYYYSYMPGDKGIYYRKGVFLRQTGLLPFANLSSVSFEQSLVYRMLDAVRIRAETDAGGHRRADFKATLTRAQADALRAALAQSTMGLPRKGDVAPSRPSHAASDYRPAWGYVLLFSVLTSKSLSGVLFASTFISVAGAIVGRSLRDELISSISALAEEIAFGLPPLAIAVSIVIAGGWLFSFLRNVLRYLRFSLSRGGQGRLSIATGMFTPRIYELSVPRINFLDLRQTLLTKLLSVSSAYIHCSGYGKGKDEIAVLIPAASKRSILHTARRLLPDLLPVSRPSAKAHSHVSWVRSPGRTFPRYVTLTLLLMAAIPLAARIPLTLFPEWWAIIRFTAGMAEIPAVWLLLVKIVSYFTSGFGFDGQTLALRYSSGYAFHTVAVPMGKVAELRIRQSAFQQRAGYCDVVVYTSAETPVRHKVPNLRLSDLQALKITPHFPIV